MYVTWLREQQKDDAHGNESATQLEKVGQHPPYAYKKSLNFNGVSRQS